MSDELEGKHGVQSLEIGMGILRAMADALGVSVGFDSFDQLRAAMIAAVPALGVEGLANYGALSKSAKAKATGTLAGYPIKDFYLTNPIARASAYWRSVVSCVANRSTQPKRFQ